MWKDNTAREDLEAKEAKLQRLDDEQKLSKLMREEECVAAALLAFKMNKLREFYHSMNRLVMGKNAPCRAHIPGMPQRPGEKPIQITNDPLQTIINSKADFDLSIQGGAIVLPKHTANDKITEVVTILMKKETKKLIDVVKKLNARSEFSNLSQILLREILPRLDTENLESEDLTDVKGLLTSTELYSHKHLARSNKSLKESYYVRFVMGQLTLLTRKIEESKVAEKSKDPVKSEKKQKKRDKKLALKSKH